MFEDYNSSTGLVDAPNPGTSRDQALIIAAEIAELAKLGKPYRLIGSRIAIVREAAREQIGRIIVPDSAKERLLAGTIVLLGNGIGIGEEAPMYEHVKVGQWCTFNKYNGVEHKIHLPGRDVIVEVIHARDLYIVYDGNDAVSPFEENPLTAVKEELGG